MPERNQFDAADKYYSVLLHELGHWTGHQDRLKRDIVNKFGTPDYAREELRAEIASMMIGAELQIGSDPKRHISYVDSWIKILQDTPFEIHAAASDAQKIFDYILDIERKREIKEERVNDKAEKNSPNLNMPVIDNVPFYIDAKRAEVQEIKEFKHKR